MSPEMREALAIQAGAPRASGDEPKGSIMTVSTVACAPRERG